MFWSRLKITANRSRLDQSYVIKKLGENYKLEATPLWKFSHLILGLKKWFVSSVYYWSSYWHCLGHHINNSDRKKQMALEFLMDSAAVCSFDKNAKVIHDKKKICCIWSLIIFHFLPGNCWIQISIHWIIAKGVLCKFYADITEKRANIEYVFVAIEN